MLLIERTKSIIGSSLVFLIFVYLIVPFAFKYFPFIQRNLIFMNHVNTQYNFNLSHPEQSGLKCTRTLRLSHRSKIAGYNQDIELGVWHVLPGSSLHSCETTNHNNRTFIDDKLAFKDSRPIILYLHGNGGTRAGDHRTQLYKVLAYDLDYHIVTFDYRGYGDSTYLQPSTDGLSSDAQFMYRWLLRQPNVDKDRVTVWGHSLGTAIAVRMISSLEPDLSPAKLILEAPFDSMASAIANHPFSYPFRVMPHFDSHFVDPIRNSPDLNFDTADRIVNIKSTEILIIHAEDDSIIPMKLGLNLYVAALRSLGDTKVRFLPIRDPGLGHKYICSHRQSMMKVKYFLEDLTDPTIPKRPRRSG